MAYITPNDPAQGTYHTSNKIIKINISSLVISYRRRFWQSKSFT